MVKARKEMIHLLDTIDDTDKDTDEEELSPSSGEWY